MIATKERQEGRRQKERQLGGRQRSTKAVESRQSVSVNLPFLSSCNHVCKEKCRQVRINANLQHGYSKSIYSRLRCALQ